MNDDPVNVVNSKYYSINEIQSLKAANKNKFLFIFHINACSLNKNFDDLEYLPKCTKKIFNVVAVTETRITKNTSKLCNIKLTNYESSAGGTLLYIVNQLSYKPRINVKIYKKSELESTFVEIIIQKSQILLLV